MDVGGESGTVANPIDQEVRHRWQLLLETIDWRSPSDAIVRGNLEVEQSGQFRAEILVASREVNFRVLERAASLFVAMDRAYGRALESLFDWRSSVSS